MKENKTKSEELKEGSQSIHRKKYVRKPPKEGRFSSK